MVDKVMLPQLHCTFTYVQFAQYNLYSVCGNVPFRNAIIDGSDFGKSPHVFSNFGFFHSGLFV
jgi:hypothetical protein